MSCRRTIERIAWVKRPSTRTTSSAGSAAASRSASSSSINSSDSAVPELRGGAHLVGQRPAPQDRARVCRSGAQGRDRGAQARARASGSGSRRRLGLGLGQARAQATGSGSGSTGAGSAAAGARLAQGGRPHRLQHGRQPFGELRHLLPVSSRTRGADGAPDDGAERGDSPEDRLGPVRADQRPCARRERLQLAPRPQRGEIGLGGQRPRDPSAQPRAIHRQARVQACGQLRQRRLLEHGEQPGFRQPLALQPAARSPGRRPPASSAGRIRDPCDIATLYHAARQPS